MLIIDYSGAANAAAMTTDVNRNKYNKNRRKTCWPRARQQVHHISCCRLAFLVFLA
ncbi:hypothetical protein [Duganella phyllosphaerae]|uniref:hypothetical protein n=1 Tax=Duganella phyllosphaerae TaxID=762836 RepID=UPI001428CECE|nr:hypothetical protein [Duganella phyllosphaerae]